MNTHYLMAMLAVAAFPSLFAQTGENGLIFTPVSDTEASVSSDSTLTRKADISIPETVTINGHSYTVTEVAPNAFANNTNISSVALPSTLVTIGDHAFDGCTALKAIELPANLET
ncbi:MAG: leucine-rich repeat domain-containing protein, partial [Muribaculaceae bacterium]|nr:leucine-rich repeat domain-containing protein [Muribaculaceae bacterium]